MEHLWNLRMDYVSFICARSWPPLPRLPCLPGKQKTIFFFFLDDHTNPRPLNCPPIVFTSADNLYIVGAIGGPLLPSFPIFSSIDVESRFSLPALFRLPVNIT